GRLQGRAAAGRGGARGRGRGDGDGGRRRGDRGHRAGADGGPRGGRDGVAGAAAAHGDRRPGGRPAPAAPPRLDRQRRLRRAGRVVVGTDPVGGLLRHEPLRG